MKKILFSIFTVLLVVNMFAVDTPEPAQQQKFYDWSIAQFNREQMHITSAYSNAVYQALFPRLAEAIQQLELPVPQPFTAEQVKWISIYKASPEVTTGFAGDSSLLMSPCGLFYRYHSPSSLFYERAFRQRDIFTNEDMSIYTTDVSAFKGKNRMSREEIIGMARQLKERLCKTGYSDVLFTMEGEPEINGPFDVKDGQVPYAKVSWGEKLSGSWDNHRGIFLKDKRDDLSTPLGNYFEVEINTDKKQIVSFWIKPTIENLARHFSYQIPEGLPLKLTENPETETEYKQRILGKRYSIIGQNIRMTETYSNAVLKIMLPRVTELAKKLELPIELPVTEGQVKEFKINQYGYIGGILILKNGWQFTIDTTRIGKVFSLRVLSPDHFFPMENNRTNLNPYYGTNKMTEAEIIEYSRDIAGRLGLKELMKGRKQPYYMNGPFRPNGSILKELPHVYIQWKATSGEPYYFLSLEFNTETKKIGQVILSLSEPLFEYDIVMGNTENEDLYPEMEAAYQARMLKETVKN